MKSINHHQETDTSMLEAATILLQMADFKIDDQFKKPVNDREETDASVLEAASILIQMANSKSDDELKKSRPKRKRAEPETEKTEAKNVPRERKPPRKKKMKEKKLTTAPEMPAAMRERNAEIGGYIIEQVIQKQLHETDLNRNHGRLSVPIKKLRYDFATEEEAKNVPGVRKSPRKKKMKEKKLRSTPKMPAAMRERIAEIGGYEIELVIQKQLHETDLNRNDGRLSVPIKKLRYDFATEEEAKLLNEYDGKKNKKGMDVMMIDPVLRESVICLKKWKIGSGDVYCLVTHWNSFVQQNCLEIGEVVQLWSFRKNGVDAANQTEKPHHLCFAIAKPHMSLCL